MNSHNLHKEISWKSRNLIALLGMQSNVNLLKNPTPNLISCTIPNIELQGLAQKYQLLIKDTVKSLQIEETVDAMKCLVFLTFLSQLGFGSGRSGKALFLSTKYQGART